LVPGVSGVTCHQWHPHCDDDRNDRNLHSDKCRGTDARPGNELLHSHYNWAPSDGRCDRRNNSRVAASRICHHLACSGTYYSFLGSGNLHSGVAKIAVTSVNYTKSILQRFSDECVDSVHYLTPDHWKPITDLNKNIHCLQRFSNERGGIHHRCTVGCLTCGCLHQSNI